MLSAIVIACDVLAIATAKQIEDLGTGVDCWADHDTEDGTVERGMPMLSLIYTVYFSILKFQISICEYN
jgi:hypothetical protein